VVLLGYVHTKSIVFIFVGDLKKTAYVTFKLTKDIDITKDVLAISAMQQGDRLGKCRPEKTDTSFNPSPFLITLMTTDGELIDTVSGDE
jgi:hypothetical protein